MHSEIENSEKERGITITTKEKQDALEKYAKNYAKELVQSGAIKSFDSSWMESVFMYIVKSDASKEYHSKPAIENPSGTERLKVAYRYLNNFIIKDDLDGAIEFLKVFMFPEYDFGVLRMLLDCTNKVADEEKIIPIRKELIKLCEQKLGQKLY